MSDGDKSETQPGNRPAWWLIQEMLKLAPKRNHAKLRRLAEEVFRRGQDVTREIFGEEPGE
jgi:hypothetical protein